MRLETARDEFIRAKTFRSKTRRPASPATLRSYYWHLSGFITWVTAQTGRSSANQFTGALAAAYLEHRATTRNLRPNTLNLDSTALREFAKWGAERKLWRLDETLAIPIMAKERTLPRPYSAGDRDKLMELARTPEETALRAILYRGGLRSSEVLGLRLADVTPPSALPNDQRIPGQLRVRGKGGKPRVVPISDELWTDLVAYLKTVPAGTRLDRHLFAKADGGPWTRSMLERRVRWWGAAAGVEAPKAHRFRHTFATNILDAGGDVELRTVQELLGHASVATTQIYTQVTNRRTAAAVNLLPALPRTIPSDSGTRPAEGAEAPAKPAERQA